MEQNVENVTLYLLGGFGAHRTECRKLKIEQKNGDLIIRFTAKGKRKEEVCRLSRKPFALVLGGFNHPEQDPFDGTNSTKYASFDPRYEVEFNQMMSEYLLANPEVIVCADYRGNIVGRPETEARAFV